MPKRKSKKRTAGKKAEDLPPRRLNQRRSTSPSHLSEEQLRNIRREARARAWSSGLRQRLDFGRSGNPPPPVEVTSDDSSSATSSPPALQGSAPSANVVRPVARRRPTEDDEDDRQTQNAEPILDRGGRRKTKKRKRKNKKTRKKRGGTDGNDFADTLAEHNKTNDYLRKKAIKKFELTDYAKMAIGNPAMQWSLEYKDKLMEVFKAEGLDDITADIAADRYRGNMTMPTQEGRMRGGKKTKKRKRKKGGDDDKEKTRKKKIEDFKVNIADYKKTVHDSKNPMPPRNRPPWASPTASGWAVAPYDRSQEFIPPGTPELWALSDLKGGRKKRRRKTRKRQGGDPDKEREEVIYKLMIEKGLPDVVARNIAKQTKDMEKEERDKEIQRILREIEEEERIEREEREIEEDIRRRGRYGELW